MDHDEQKGKGRKGENAVGIQPNNKLKQFHVRLYTFLTTYIPQ